ncbi:prolipoprotein diacylglyceryl transferase [Hathewaya histolytica]|uniref:prolipoprotein diacylglyceryl transferase n=1 Tax=Hathewaya histolytica TaxID=1498 RepID=UPI003B6856E6
MRPILFSIFGLEIKGYGLMIAIGVLSALMILLNISRKRGYNEDNVWSIFFYAIIGGAVGGKLLWVITDIKLIIDEPSILLNLGYGFVIYGAIIGGVIAIYMACKKYNWNTLKFLDIAVPCVAIAQGFGRIGCLFAGCCYGAHTDSHLGIVFENSLFAPPGVRLHPTQIYSSIFDFLLGAFLLLYLKKDHKDGQVFGAYIISYSIGRFLIEFLRDDPRGSVGILSTSQFIAIFTLIFGVLIFSRYRFKKNQK